MFTDHQKELIAFCKRTGYGWAKFATSVEKQGKCSHKQQETLEKMCSTIRNHKRRDYEYWEPDYITNVYDIDEMLDHQAVFGRGDWEWGG